MSIAGQLKLFVFAIVLALISSSVHADADTSIVLDTSTSLLDTTYEKDSLLDTAMHSEELLALPSRGAGEPKEKRFPLWLAGIGMLLALLFTLHQAFLRMRNKEIFFDSDLLTGFRTAHYVRIFIFSLMAGLLAYPFFEEFTFLGYAIEGFSSYLLLTLGFILLFAVKITLYYLFYAAIELEVVGLHLIRRIVNGLFLASTLGFLIWMLATFSPIQGLGKAYPYILLTLVAALFVYRWWGILMILVRNFSHSKVFILFYFCGLEVMPLILIYHWWSK